MVGSHVHPPEESPLEMLIASRERDLGGFSVRRILPYMTHRLVGPFVFFDHMGPAEFPPHVGMDVRPHPHIHLATVTYLFEGAIRHHDSLGSDQVIEPGAINLMTAGHGIVHSERTPDDLRASGGRMNGIQCWIALPTELEDCEPSFTHHPSKTLPEFQIGRASYKLLMGSAFAHTSPVPLKSDLFYVEAKVPKGESLTIGEPSREAAVYCVKGRLRESTCATEFGDQTMAVLKNGAHATFEALEDSHLMILGGAFLGPRFLYWNFVSSSQENIEAAKAEWAKGPGAPGSRFPKVAGDESEFIPLPTEPAPRGTPL